MQSSKAKRTLTIFFADNKSIVKVAEILKVESLESMLSNESIYHKTLKDTAQMRWYAWKIGAYKIFIHISTRIIFV